MKRTAHPPRRRSGGSVSTPSRAKIRKSAQRKTQFNPLHVVACGAAAAQQFIALSDDGDDDDDDEESSSSEALTAESPVAVKRVAEGDKGTVAWGTLVWERRGGFANSFCSQNLPQTCTLTQHRKHSDYQSTALLKDVATIGCDQDNTVVLPPGCLSSILATRSSTISLTT